MNDLTQMTNEALDAAIEEQYRRRDAAQTLAELTREHRILRCLQKEGARRIEAWCRANLLMPPKNGEPDLLDQAKALLERYGATTLAGANGRN